mmetsp:Transcript_49940/g.116611  ORF Transcript_49940/g.116611 Transcript_49940/m.116611 type:complete len:139 (-) Transcript_49940:822-1238(-)
MVRKAVATQESGFAEELLDKFCRQGVRPAKFQQAAQNPASEAVFCNPNDRALNLPRNEVAGGHRELCNDFLHNIVSMRAHYGLQDVAFQLLGHGGSIPLNRHLEHLLHKSASLSISGKQQNLPTKASDDALDISTATL